MKVANIVPGGLLEAVIGNDPDERYHLILASECLGNDEYLEFYQSICLKNKHHVILDNDAYENDGVASPVDKILQVCRELIPTQIVLPDLMDGKTCAAETLRMSTEAAPMIMNFVYDSNKPASQNPSLIGVPHGNTREEWIECAMELAKIPFVTTLGIAEKDAIKLANGNRGVLVRAIVGLKKTIHLFGMMNDMKDIQDVWVRHVVQGVDGAKLVVWGLHGVEHFHPDAPLDVKYPGRPPEFFDIKRADVDDMILETVRNNISRWRFYASHAM